MLIGIPKEIKDNEYRVSTTPAGVAEYIAHGHQVIVQDQAGHGSGFHNDEYEATGAEIIRSAEDVWASADLIIKVKEPIQPEYDLMRPGQILYTYLHLAAEEELTRALVAQQVTAIAYETVELPDGSLPLLVPMSEVAGRMSSQIAAHYLARVQGGIGLLMGGVPGVKPADVTIIGGGIVGINAAQIALGLGANVTIIDVSMERLRYLDQVLHGRVNTLASSTRNIHDAACASDVVIGGVLIAGAKAPKLVSAETVTSMKEGSVIVDVAIDQGGCFETSRPTSHSNPTYLVDGVLHYCVTNMPGAMPRTSTFALSNVTLPWGLLIADNGLDAVRANPALAKGLNVYKAQVTYEPVAEACGIPYTPLSHIL